MRKSATTYLVLLSFSLLSQSEYTFFNDVNSFMLDHVLTGKVDYKNLIKNTAELDKLVGQIASYDISDKDSNHQLAFYINAYNLLVIKQITNHYPISGPLAVNGFFNKYWHTVASERVTLDQLEFDKIFRNHEDPRIHFALGCAAKSCPYLYDNAYTPEHIQEQLNFRSQLIIDQTTYVTVDDNAKTVTVSKIFDWYKDIFNKDSGSILKFINKHRHYKVPENYSVNFFKYDWGLNER